MTALAPHRLKPGPWRFYQDVARKPRYAVMADDAAFRILMLGHPSISDYERYAAKYPGAVT